MRNNINLPKLNINVYSNKIKNNEDDTFFEMLTQIKTSRNRVRLAESKTFHKRVFSEHEKFIIDNETTELDANCAVELANKIYEQVRKEHSNIMDTSTLRALTIFTVVLELQTIKGII